MSPTESLAVVGGGVIGLSVARRAALDGWSVRVHRTEDRGASWVAGGMLAPHSEGWPGEERLLQIGLASLALWHDGLPRRSAAGGGDRARVAGGRRRPRRRRGPDDGGGVARRAGPAGDADHRRPRRRAAARPGHPARLRAPKPNWPSTTGRWSRRWRSTANGSACVGRRRCESLDDTRDADTAVIANGIDAPALWPGLPIRPVKGEVLRLRWRRGCMPLPQRVIRARVHGTAGVPGAARRRRGGRARRSTSTAATPRPRCRACATCSTTPAR